MASSSSRNGPANMASSSGDVQLENQELKDEMRKILDAEGEAGLLARLYGHNRQSLQPGTIYNPELFGMARELRAASEKIAKYAYADGFRDLKHDQDKNALRDDRDELDDDRAQLAADREQLEVENGLYAQRLEHLGKKEKRMEKDRQDVYKRKQDQEKRMKALGDKERDFEGRLAEQVRREEEYEEREAALLQREQEVTEREAAVEAREEEAAALGGRATSTTDDDQDENQEDHYSPPASEYGNESPKSGQGSPPYDPRSPEPEADNQSHGSSSDFPDSAPAYSNYAVSANMQPFGAAGDHVLSPSNISRSPIWRQDSPGIGATAGSRNRTPMYSARSPTQRGPAGASQDTRSFPGYRKLSGSFDYSPTSPEITNAGGQGATVGYSPTSPRRRNARLSPDVTAEAERRHPAAAAALRRSSTSRAEYQIAAGLLAHPLAPRNGLGQPPARLGEAADREKGKKRALPDDAENEVQGDKRRRRSSKAAKSGDHVDLTEE